MLSQIDNAPVTGKTSLFVSTFFDPQGGLVLVDSRYGWSYQHFFAMLSFAPGSLQVISTRWARESGKVLPFSGPTRRCVNAASWYGDPIRTIPALKVAPGTWNARQATFRRTGRPAGHRESCI